MDKIIVHKEDAGKRLDKFLTEKMPEFSRSQIKKKILAEEILVNNSPADVHEFLKDGDAIEITEYGPETMDDKPEKVSLGLEPKIIFEDENFLVIEKPSGMLAHPTPRGEPNTLVHWL